jgi:hypothetical protein
MKKTLILLFALAGLSTGLQAQSIFEQWPALDDFHEVMADTYHSSEAGDLAPLRARSAEMAEKARLLAQSGVPADFDTPEIAAAAKQLKKDSKKLHKQKAKGKAADAELVAGLASLHDVFHRIVGLCRDEEH